MDNERDVVLQNSKMDDAAVHLTIEVAELPIDISRGPSVLHYTLRGSRLSNEITHNAPIAIQPKTLFDNRTDDVSLETEAAISILKYEASISRDNESDDPPLVADDRPYKCQMCGKGFTEPTIRNTHMLTHSSKRDYTCPYDDCDFAFKTKGSLTRHIRRHTGERPFRCSDCGRNFRESGALRRHKNSRTPCIAKNDEDLPRYGVNFKLSKSKVKIEKDIQCVNEIALQDCSEICTAEEEISIPDIGEQLEVSKRPTIQVTCLACNELFDNKIILREHLQSHIDCIPYHCSNCNFCTYNEESFWKHRKKHQTFKNGFNSQDTDMCSNSSLIKAVDVNDEEDSRSDEENDTDSRCKQALTALTQLSDMGYMDSKQSKTQINLTPNLQKCPYCSRCFRGRSYLRVHLLTHTGERPHKCPHCLKGFTTRDSLNKHLFVHSDERQYKCGECGKMFKRISHVEEHLKSHSTDRPYECSSCKKRFKTSNACKVHVRTHTKTTPWQCSFCSKAFREKGSLERHLRKHTGAKPYQCKHCKRCFSEHGTLNRHLKAKVPCYMQNETEQSDHVSREPSVLAEFSSVVAETHQYILPMDSTELQETDVKTENHSSTYVLVNQGNDRYILVDSLSGETVDVTMGSTKSDGKQPIADLIGSSLHQLPDNKPVVTDNGNEVYLVEDNSSKDIPVYVTRNSLSNQGNNVSSMNIGSEDSEFPVSDTNSVHYVALAPNVNL